ncbi:hypothetical protein OBBRIDRAFT_833148 [Obba rivulosa]|uniref:Uncharacterized protein n=1 Tax=Obba rivulosa TaxID=1052685 RepID=A0A8E2AY72_9APHY|nr:hypothetical protein OBBRIDRAFT_833148 [Obba rivulosa]
MHVGSSEAGHDYEKSSSDFDKETIEPFISFLKKVYSKEVHQTRALGYQPPPSDAGKSMQSDGLADELITSDELIALQHMLSPTPEREEPAFILSGLSNVNPTSVLSPPNPTLFVLHNTANVVVESASRAPNVPALNPHLHVPFETQSDAFGGSVGLPLSGTQPGNMSPPSDAPDAISHLGFPVSTIRSTLEPSDIPDNQMTFNSSQSKTFTHMDTTDAFGFDLSMSDVDDSIFTSIGSFDTFLSRFDHNAITPGPQAFIPEAALDPAQMADQDAGIQTVFGSTHNLDFSVFPEVQDLVACSSTSIEGPVTSGQPKQATKAPRRADKDISLASMALGKSSRHSLEVDKANVM